MSKQKKQDLNVELLRILACLMVIMIHIRPFPFDGETLRNAVVLIFVLNGPAVASFFLISGFFISGRQSLKHIYLRFLRSVILPTGIFVFVLGLIRPWIDNPAIGLFESILSSHPFTILTDIIQGFLAFDTVRFGIYADHLWYIFSYAGIMLWMPIIHGLIKHNEVTPLKITLIIAALHYTLQNLSALIVLPFGITIPEAIGKPAMYTIAGWLLYSWIKRRKSLVTAIGGSRDSFSHATVGSETHLSPDTASSKPSIAPAATDLEASLSLQSLRIISLLIFAVTSVILFMLQKHIYMSGLITGRTPAELNTDYYFTSWNGMLCAVQTVAFSAFILLIPDTIWYRELTDDEPASMTFIGKLIQVLGSYTFPIYLIHYVFTNHFRATGLESFFQNLFGKSSIGLILYSFIYSVFIFLLCSVFIFIAKKLCNQLNYLLHKVKLSEAKR